MSETVLVNQVLQYLQVRGVYAWRQNCGMRGNTRFGLVGAGDITGILNDGRRLEIECKTATGKQSPEQMEFQRYINRCGGVYILARSLDDVIAVLDKVRRVL